MSIHPIPGFFLSCVAVCLLSQCKDTSTSARVEEEPLAVVAGQAITADALRAEAEWRRTNHQSVPAPDALLKEMVDRLALVERAKQLGLADEAGTRRRIESLLIAEMRAQHLDPALAGIAVPDEELQAAYESRREEFTRKGLDRFSILFQASHSKESDRSRSGARGRLESAVALADANPASGGRGPAASGFGAVAIEHSDDQASRYRGGDIGWIESDAAQTRFPDEVLAAGRTLESGARSEIIDGGEGFYVIMKTDSRPGGLRPLAEVQETLRRSLLREKKRELEERFVGESLDLAKVEMNTDAAREITLHVSGRPARHQDQPPGFPGVSQTTSATR